MAKDELAEKITISVPPSLLKEIDQQAAAWFTTRSGAVTRIYLEWRQANIRQLNLTETPEMEKAA